jgi:hypothetical protein
MAFSRQLRARLLAALVYPALILMVNLLIVIKEFKLDYSAYLESNEGSFIAIAKHIAEHPGDLLWWPQWDLGLPYQNTYLPGLHILVGAFSRLTGHSPALSFHEVCGLFFALGPVAVYVMAWLMTRRPGASWFAALAYSVISPTAWLMPEIRNEMGSPWNLRRLQIFAYFGEGPHTSCLFFIPLAILFLYLALTKGSMWTKVVAAVCLGCAVLMNAFAAVIAALAALALVVVMPANRMARSAFLALTIAALAYLWISPLAPPSVAADIRANSHREYPLNGASAMGLANLCCSCALVWMLTRSRVSAPVRMFLLFALAVSMIVLQAYYTHCNIVPQPLRYGTTMDLGLCLSAAFGGAALWRMLPKRGRQMAVVVVIAAMAVQARHAVRYARGLIRRTDITTTTQYHMAKWMNDHINGERVLVGGSASFHFNAFTDTPQFHGGHDPMQPSTLTLIGTFMIASGMNAGDRDMLICDTWLKALGTHAISVPGPLGDPTYNTFPHPERFVGHYPVLWRESDTTIYGVPSRSHSLAHVVPPAALVRKFPVNGLDIDEMVRYVAALEDPKIPEAEFRWLTQHSANIRAKLKPGQVISIQERYTPGWHAEVNGRPQKVEHDALGLMVLRPDCTDCWITISYDGGTQWRATCIASLLVTLLGLVLLVRSAIRRHQSEPAPIPDRLSAPRAG